MQTLRLPAEWEPQDGVLLAWPHAATDWKPYLSATQFTFARVIAAITRHERVVLVTSAPAESDAVLRKVGAVMDRVTSLSLPTNDTWARDFGPITVLEDDTPFVLDFQFTGWGGKFPADLDDQITRRLKDHGVFGSHHLRTIHFILEGGAIESDGSGTILTTRSCLANPNRYGRCAPSDIETSLQRFIGATRVCWLDNGYLAGDDTDGHVDMLARFAPHDTLVYTACDAPGDEHYPALSEMAEELSGLRTREGHPYRLLPLPWPAPVFDEEGHRLPASYANFLVINGAVLVPTYNDPSDPAALEVVGHAFPGRKIVGIDASPLIRQHGSLHCVTMQLPKGLLA
jgi:agmatine deiminase